MSDSSTAIPQGRLAGVDYGTVRIGIAVTDADQKIASPLENYTRRGEDADAAFFKQLALQEKIVCFVLGLPVHLAGHESQKSLEVRKFGQWLIETTGVSPRPKPSKCCCMPKSLRSSVRPDSINSRHRFCSLRFSNRASPPTTSPKVSIEHQSQLQPDFNQAQGLRPLGSTRLSLSPRASKIASHN
jgi:hypothetical protein